MATGTVNVAKGFWLITPDSGGEDLFAHSPDIQGSGFSPLQKNQKDDRLLSRRSSTDT
jgi:CspA family cold shock protein